MLRSSALQPADGDILIMPVSEIELERAALISVTIIHLHIDLKHPAVLPMAPLVPLYHVRVAVSAIDIVTAALIVPVTLLPLEIGNESAIEIFCGIVAMIDEMESLGVEAAALAIGSEIREETVNLIGTEESESAEETKNEGVDLATHHIDLPNPHRQASEKQIEVLCDASDGLQRVVLYLSGGEISSFRESPFGSKQGAPTVACCCDGAASFQ
jgi:hypothetical protein